MKMNKTVRAPKVLKKGEVLTTKNYDLFKFLSCNRDISQANSKKLLQSLGKKKCIWSIHHFS